MLCSLRAKLSAPGLRGCIGPDIADTSGKGQHARRTRHSRPRPNFLHKRHVVQCHPARLRSERLHKLCWPSDSTWSFTTRPSNCKASNWFSNRGRSKLNPSFGIRHTKFSPSIRAPPKTDSDGYPQLTSPGLVMMEAARSGAVVVFLTANANPFPHCHPPPSVDRASIRRTMPRPTSPVPSSSS